MEVIDQPVILRRENLSCQKHINPELEIIYVTAGEMTVDYDGRSVNLGAGQLLVVLPFHLHGFAPGVDCVATVYLFERQIVEKSLGGRVLPLAFAPVAVSAVTDAYLTQLQERVSPEPEFYAVSLFCTLAGDWLAAIENQTEIAVTETEDQKLISYISAHLTEDLTMERLAQYMGVTPRRLSEGFRKKYRIKLVEFIDNVRLERAMTLLYATDLNITQISSLAGFATPRSFNRSFQAKMDCTPSQFRRKKSLDS